MCLQEIEDLSFLSLKTYVKYVRRSADSILDYVTSPK